MSARTVGTYELEGLLGEGGIGQVYAAHDTVLGRHVAIKTLRPELSGDRNFVDRFYREAKSLATLNHTNITTLYALHAEGDEAFMVMELVEGQTLEALLARVGRLNLRESLAILAQAIPGIRYAHRRGVIHRDLKPANLMLTDEGVVKIMDFGIARVRGSQHLTQVGEFVGTFVYASPEQIRGEEVDERSDLYSLAIVFYRMLAGKAPFTSDNEYALMTAHMQTPPPPLVGQVSDVDEATQSVLMRALAKRPEDRFASVEEFGRAIGATALRDDSADILQQLYARVFEEHDLDKTRVIPARRFDATPGSTPPSNRSDWRLADSGVLPGPARSAPADPEPWSNGADGQVVAPSPRVAVLQSPTGLADRPRGRLVWLIGAGALALPLLIGAGYYLFVANGVMPSLSTSPPPASAEAVKSEPPPVEAAKSEVRSPHALPPLIAAAKREAQAPPALPPPIEAAKSEVQSSPAPPSVEAAKAAVQPPAAPVEAATTEVQPPTAPVEAAKTEVQPPPAPPSVEAAKSEVKPPAALVEAAKSEVQPALPPVEAAKSEVEPPTAPVEAAKAEVQPLPAPPPVEAAKSAKPPPPSAEAGKSEVQEPAPEDPTADTQIASAQPPPPEKPAAPGPPAQPTPEGAPDLQGRVTGLKGLNEIELDKTHWIKIYGIVDRTPHASRHTEALLRYLKPSHNYLVCYRKPANTYRCYSDGQDIARLALLDRLVQLAPGAPAEYRSLLAQRR